MAYKCRRKLKSDLSRRYNISVKVYETLLKGAEYQCMICSKHREEGAVLCVDHCKDTGKVKGIACASCNAALGMLQHDPEILKKAIEYLKDF